MAMNLAFKPFSGVGITTFYKRNAVTGLPSGGGYDLGEPGQIDLTNNAPRVEINTQRTSDRGVAFSWAGSKAANLSIQLRTVNDFIWSLLTSGTFTDVAASAAVVDWVAPTDLVVGQHIKLPHQNVSAVTVKDSAGSPATLVAGTHYDTDQVGGTIRLLNLGAFTQPLKVSYTPGAVKVIGALRAPDEDYIVHFAGVNSYDESRVILEAYRFRFAAEGALALVQTEAGTYTLNGSLQKDETKAANDVGGQYYKLVQPGA